MIIGSNFEEKQWSMDDSTSEPLEILELGVLGVPAVWSSLYLNDSDVRFLG